MADADQPRATFTAEVEALFADKLREFCAWCAENWTMTATEARTLTKPTDNPLAYARGYTDAMVDGLSGAADHWLGEIEGVECTRY